MDARRFCGMTVLALFASMIVSFTPVPGAAVFPALLVFVVGCDAVVEACRRG